jgi:precorrin-2/cobalt-factor-2 C20-methyltransferase
MTGAQGKLYGIGVGPGDPELVTLKAARLIAAADVVAFFAKKDRPGHAHRIAGSHIAEGATRVRLEYPYTTEIPSDDQRYRDAMTAFYDTAAATLSSHLGQGRAVAVLCEGDPFLYGSFIHLFERLSDVPCEVVPGVTAMAGCWSEAATPMTRAADVLCVLPGTLEEDDLAARLAGADAAVIMKIGRNLPKIQKAVMRAGLGARAVYVEHGTQKASRIQCLAQKTDEPAPYFSLVLIPAKRPSP